MKTTPRVPPAFYGFSVGIWALALAILGWAMQPGTPAVLVAPNGLLVALCLVVFIAVAGALPLALLPTVKINVATAPLFAAALVFPTPIAVCTGLLGTIAAHAYLQARRRRVWQDLFFNSGRTMLQIVLAGCVFQALAAGHGTHNGLVASSWAVAVAVGAAAYYLVNVTTVYGAAALMVPQNPLLLWWSSLAIEGTQQAALLLFGVVTAVIVELFPILGLAMVFPVCVVYYSLRTSMALRAHTQSAVEAIADAVDMRAFGSSGHSRRVADLAVRLAQRLDLSPDEVQIIGRAARVHDIGKVGFSDALLRQPEGGGPDEVESLRRHPAFGAEILAPFPEYQRCRHLVRLHHERPDGTGYPDGRAAGQIPVGAAIIAVAETFDALTADRPYRAAISPAQACSHIERGADTLWDGRVVRALLAEQQAADLSRRGGIRTGATAAP